MKVLLVDDDYIALEGVSKMLHWDKFEGQVIGCVSDGLEAISVIQQQVPDVVISDIKMPRMDGIELAQYLYTNHRSVRIILLSGHGEFEYAQKALQYRVFSYILKPITRTKVEELEEQLIHINNELKTKNTLRNLSSNDDLQTRIVAILNKGSTKELQDLVYSGEVASALLNDREGTLGITLLNWLFSHQKEIGKNQILLSELKKKCFEDYWTLKTPQERRDFLLSCYLETMSYSESQKSEHIKPIVSRCIQIIHQQFRDPFFNISQLADQMNISPPYLSTIFKKYTGQNISSYLSQQRLTHAQNLLKDVSIPIQDVCVQSGYEDPHYFARVFKNKTGVTPSEYRNLYGLGDFQNNVSENKG